LLLPALWQQTVGQQSLAVEQIYGTEAFRARTLTDLQWIPDGSGFTYTEKDQETGDFEPWRYDLSSGSRTRLIDSEAVRLPIEKRYENRFALDTYVWSPTGTDLLLPQAEDLYLYHFSSRELTRLTEDEAEERDPQFSPDGQQLSFLKNDNLQVLDVRTHTVRQLTEQGTDHLLIGRFDWVYEEEFGIRTGFIWSPDGRSIAYFQVDERATPEFPIVDFIPVHNAAEPMRYPKAGDVNSIVRIGVVPVDGDPVTTWMDIGEETDIYIPRIAWLPDGRTLAIQRLNRQQNRLDVLLADAATGASRIILTENAQGGWIELNDMWIFLKNEPMFIWPSQRDGYLHLHLYQNDGQLVRQLTRGEWEVTSLDGVDEASGLVYFTGTEKDVLERHLYRINLDGTRLERLTHEDGTHSINMSPHGPYYIDTFSDTETPPGVSLFSADGKLKDVLLRNEMKELFEKYELSAPEFFTIPADDGEQIEAYLIKPPHFDPARKYPVLIYAYGGPGSQIVSDIWSVGKGGLWHQLMAEKGYIIFGLDNRGTGNRGTEWMWKVYRNLGDYEVRDHVSGVRFLRTLPYVDVDRVGIWGWSYGGYTACMCLLKAPDHFQAGVAVAPVTDWRNYDTIYAERYMDTPANNPEGYKASSAISYADHLTGKLLLVHGSSDDNVHVANTMQLAKALQDKGRPFRLMIYPGKSHGIGSGETRVHLFNMITEFFLENL